jgi:hypothetical protein
MIFKKIIFLISFFFLSSSSLAATWISGFGLFDPNQSVYFYELTNNSHYTNSYTGWDDELGDVPIIERDTLSTPSTQTS